MKFFGSLVSITNKKKINLKIENTSILLKDLILELSNSFGKIFKEFVLTRDEKKIQSYVIILVNEVSIELLDNLMTPIKDFDVITFLPSIHGGI